MLTLSWPSTCTTVAGHVQPTRESPRSLGEKKDLRTLLCLTTPEYQSPETSTSIRLCDMFISSSAIALAVASYAAVIAAHNIQLGAHSRECFHEQLHTGDKMTVTFQVGDREFGVSSNLEIDFSVCSVYSSPI